MSMYLYEAYDADHNIKKDKIKQNSEQEVLSYLENRNLSPILIKKCGILDIDLQDLINFSNKTALRKKDIALFCNQLEFVLSSGLPMDEGLRAMEQQCDNKLIKKEISNLKEGVLKGEALSSCMEKGNILPHFLCSMVRVGEESGQLSVVMQYMADHYEKEADFTEHIKSILVYPAFVFVSMIVVVIIALVYLIPNYAMIFLSQDIALPAPTRALIAISDFINNFYLGIILSCISLFILYHFLNKNPLVIKYRGKLALKTPILGEILKTSICLNFSRSMAIMVKAGVPVLNAVNMSKDLTKNYDTKQGIKKMYESLRSGQSFRESLEKVNVFPFIIVSMIGVAEVAGNLESSLDKSTEYFSKDMDAKIKIIEKLIEPTITIFLGAILAFIMLSITLPTFYLTSNI